MKKALCIATGIALALALAARADDFWKRKPPQEWTAEEAVQVLRNSPWAKQESVAAAFVNCDSDVYGDSEGCREARARMRERGDRGGRALPAQEFNLAVYLVRWDSATVVTAAFARLETLGERALANFQSPPPRRPADRYVITLNAVQPAKGGGAPFALREKSSENSVRLKTSRGTFLPAETEHSGVGANEAMHFFFAREQDGKPILDLGGDMAEFVFEGKKLTVKTKFSLDADSLR